MKLLGAAMKRARTSPSPALALLFALGASAYAPGSLRLRPRRLAAPRVLAEDQDVYADANYDESRDGTWEPPEFEENRQAARKRRERFSPMDKKGDARRKLLDAQRAFKRSRAKPAYLPLVAEAALENATTGAWFPGVVRSLKPHGAWVSIGSEVDGFVHCRDMSDSSFISDARDALRVGDEVDCCVKGADAAKRVLSLSLLQVEAPEDAAGRAPVKAFAVDQLLENVEVARVTEHAAFVDVGAAVPAYLHVADIGLLPRTKVGAARVPRLRLEKAGQVIDKCWVKSVDIARDRLRLSLVPPEERDDWTLYGARSKRDEPRVVDDRDDFEA